MSATRYNRAAAVLEGRKIDFMLYFLLILLDVSESGKRKKRVISFLYPVQSAVPGGKRFGLNRTTVLPGSDLLNIPKGVSKAGSKATLVVLGHNPKLS